MYSRKVQQSIIQSSPNLKSVILENNVNTTKSYFFRYSFMIRQITLADTRRNLRDVKNKMRILIQDAIVFKSIRNSLTTIPRNLKDQSSNLLRVWAHQCECVFAQRLRRGQQMFCLYSKLWEERALKEFLNRMRQQMTKRSKELVFSAVGITAYNWDNNRIPDEEIIKHMDELDYIYLLREKTISCTTCAKKKSDMENSNISFCECAGKNIQKSYDEWIPFIEKKDLIVWRRLHNSGHYEYKVYGSYSDVSAEDFLNVQIDTEYRRDWDNTAISLEVIEKDPNPAFHGDIVYWEMMWPRLFANRDYVFNRRFMINHNNKTVLIVSRGTDHPACPLKPKKFRVQDYWSYMIIRPYTELDKTGIEFGLTYFDNPGVNIPSAVTTWVAIRAMPDFLTRLHEATKAYKSYCIKKGTYRICNILEHRKQYSQNEENDLMFDKSMSEAKSAFKKSSGKSKKKTVQESDSKHTVSGRAIEPAPGADILTSPSPTVQADLESQSYWKYLHPTYYFS